MKRVCVYVLRAGRGGGKEGTHLEAFDDVEILERKEGDGGEGPPSGERKHGEDVKGVPPSAVAQPLVQSGGARGRALTGSRRG